MIEIEIIEGNKLIAGFMGVDVYDTYEQMRAVDIEKLKQWVLPEQIKYQSSWDWLMPVVEKIARLKLKYSNVDEVYNPYPTTFAMPDEEGNFMVRIHAHQLFAAPTLIEATWLAVVDFIKSYNQ